MDNDGCVPQARAFLTTDARLQLYVLQTAAAFIHGAKDRNQSRYDQINNRCHTGAHVLFNALHCTSESSRDVAVRICERMYPALMRHVEGWVHLSRYPKIRALLI